MTREGEWVRLEYARFADDLAVLVDGHPRHDRLLGQVAKRLREELARLEVEVNEEKSRTVDLARGESFGYLGFDIRRVRTRSGKWRVLATPKGKKRTELLDRLKVVFRSLRSQPVNQVIAKINPMLRGWVNYFAHGNASRCFSLVRDWVAKKVRRHLARNSKRTGFGWKRWSRRWLCLIGHITLGVKRAGEPCAGNPHARFERAGAGDGLTATTKRARSRKRRRQPSQSLRSTAPVPDPTIQLFGGSNELSFC